VRLDAEHVVFGPLHKVGPHPADHDERRALATRQEGTPGWSGAMMGDITLRLGVLLVAATIATPALAQTPAEDVTAAMRGQLAAEVLEGCKAELRQHCADVTPGRSSARLPVRV
jgi:hypothetical protein